MSERSRNVFVNCPFDEEFRGAFEAIVFAVSAMGYKPRCALEENDSGHLRLDKLYRLIENCDITIHDLSRTEPAQNPVHGVSLPRFNMPFELGVTLGAKRFGGTRQKRKRTLVMVRRPHLLGAYLSDLAGVDPVTHALDAAIILSEIRKFLHRDPAGQTLPGAAYCRRRFGEFRAALPKLARRAGHKPEEMHPIFNYRVFLETVVQYVASR